MAEIEQLYKRADEAFRKRSYDYARDLFMQILLLAPDHAQARKALRATILQKFKEQGAPGKLRLMALRSQIEVQLKTTRDVQKKIDFCQQHLNEDPDNSKIRTILADHLLSLNHNEGAAVEAEAAAEADRNSISTAKVLVAALKALGQVKEAQAALDRISSRVKEDRDLERLQRDLAAMQTMKAGFTEARTFRDVMKNSSQAEDLEKRHHLIQTDADLEAVLESLRREMGDAPTDAKIPKKIGDLLFDKKKDYEAAREWYKRASLLAPQDSVLRDRVDDCALRLQDLQIEAAAKGADPNLAELRKNRLKFQIQSYERRVQDRPTDMGLRFELGRSYYLAGPAFLDRAIGEFQQSVKDPKRKSDCHLYLGMAFQSKKIFDMADKQYQMAEEGVLSQDRKMGILYNRAKCLAEAGKIPEAIELGKRIMEVDISYKDISQLVEKWQNGAK